MKTQKIIFSCLVVASLVCLGSCSDDDTTALEPIASPIVTVTKLQHDQMTLAWDKVDGVYQYGFHAYAVTGKLDTMGITNDIQLDLADLEPVTEYVIQVKAFPKALGTALESEYATLRLQTPFYPAIEDWATAYRSSLQSNGIAVTNRGTLSEDRSSSDYDATWYGVFTISKFFGVKGKDLVFRVNRDLTINILNGTGDRDAQGRVCVLTGKPATYKVDKIYIDEQSAVFDYKNHKLTFSAANNGKGSDFKESTTETITWTEPEE